jgi:putative peptide zinc metalloprotease protein
VRQFKPAQAPGIVWKELDDASGRHFILKNPRVHTYARLSPEEFWLWQRMDGAHTVEQLVMEYFMEYHAFAFAAAIGLMNRLRALSMLSEPPGVLFRAASRALAEQTVSHKVTWLARLAFTKEFVIRGLDGHLDRIHRYGGWLLFTIPVQVLFALIAVGGLVVFGLLAEDPRSGILQGGIGAAMLKLGLLAYIPLVIHEFGHAITAKHFGCEVYKGGAMLYYGLPAAFVDTTDVWMHGKRARLAVTWAGPYTGYIIAGACSLTVFAFPNISHATTLLQIALVSIFVNTFNLLPALKLDGYYMLADWLEIPGLRERSVEFISHGLRPKFVRREKWTREEWIFLGFGIIAIVSTIWFTLRGIAFWDAQASHSITALLHQEGDLRAMAIDAGVALLALSGVAYLLLTLYRHGAGLLEGLRRAGWLSTRGRAAVSLAFGGIILIFLPSLLLPTLAPWVITGGGILAFALAAWLALGNYRSMRGSIHSPMWLVAAAGAVAGAAVFLTRSAGSLSVGLDLAGLVLSLVGLLLGGRLLSGLSGSWRAASIALFAVGLVAWVGSLLIHILLSADQALTLAGLLVAGGLLHWRMRPAAPRAEYQGEEEKTTARGRLVKAFGYIKATILSELELDFGIRTRQRVESGAYRTRQSLLRKKQKITSSEAQFNSTKTGMTPDDYGGAIAVLLEELLIGVQNAAGNPYARRALADGVDGLGWELQELAEDYLLKYIPQATGLSKQLDTARDSHKDVEALVRGAPIFAALSDEESAAVSEQFRSRLYDRHEIIIRQGDAGDSFDLIRRGKVEVIRTDGTGEHVLAEIGRGDYFGQAALLTGERRNATVRAMTPVEVLVLRRDDFSRLLRKFALEGSFEETMRRLAMLRQIPLFADFQGAELGQLVNRLQRIELPASQTIFEQGESGDRFYVIESGRVSVQMRTAEDGQGELVERAVLGPGEYFGEMALMMNRPRAADVITTEPTVLLALDSRTFGDMIATSEGMQRALERASSGRVLSNRRWLEQNEPRQTQLTPA